MANKHKGPPGTFSLGRKFIGCWMIHILIPPCKHPLCIVEPGLSGSVPQLWGASYTCRCYRPFILWGQHSRAVGDGKIQSGTDWHSVCVTELLLPCTSRGLASWVAHDINAFCGCFQWRPLPLVPAKGRNRYRFVTFQTLRLIFPLITLKNRSYLYTLRSITVSLVTNHPPSALSMMWKIVAI